jgi:AcrR family transcriptional regulator
LERLSAALGYPDPDQQPPSERLQGWEMVESTLVAGFGFMAENPDFVRLIQREALDHGSRVGVDLVSVMRPMFDRAADYFRQEMGRGTFRAIDPEELLLTGWGVLLSYFSTLPFIAALTADDPLNDERLQQRLNHILEFFRLALIP